MKYEQRNPLPMPETGAYHAVKGTIETVFDWQYALEKQNLMALYEKGKELSWNAKELDWSVDVDVERMVRQRNEMGMGGMLNNVLNPPKQLSDEELVTLNLHMNSFMLSQFLHGEQGALVATAKIVQAAPTEEAKFYAANQVADEARHVEVYHRYLTEKLGISYEVHPSLGTLLDDIVTDSRWDVTYLGMQIMVEGLALAAFGMQKLMMQDEPLIQDITSRIMGDESRHVAFGVLSLEGLYADMSEGELREREDFIIDATHLMRERLMMHQVFDRLGWDKAVWIPWMDTTPFMQGFRQMLFSKIVPNLKRLGLLTPRVREAYQKIGILQYEHLKDSVEDPDVAPPEELVKLLMQFMAQNAAAGAQPAAG
ncbi:MAG TPA: ferritin-like domain-containing protein [Myxococcota bacterium]|nr:ferritin-like domain-containing protein [Myxococcota bacterium]